MKDYFAPPPPEPPRAFDYLAFIDELRVLANAPTNWPEHDMHRDSLTFKRWKHELEDLIERIRKRKYTVNTKLADRYFAPLWATASAKDRLQVFLNDLVETTAELDLVGGGTRTMVTRRHRRHPHR